MKKEGKHLTEKNEPKKSRRNSPEHNTGGQPEPLSGSKKVKQRNHSRQNHAGRG
jgi:small acid-soluble spore protein P (minor)